MDQALDTRVSTSERGERAPEANGFPRAAQVYLLTLSLATTLATGIALLHGGPGARDLMTFAILASCAAVAQFFLVGGGSYHGLHTAIAFVIAGALLLPPELVALMALVQHMPHGLKQRYPWYIQTLQRCELQLRGACRLGCRGPRRSDGRRRPGASLCAHRCGRLGRLDSRQPLCPGDHASPRTRDELPGERALLAEDDGDGPRRRIARRGARELLAVESLADAGRDRTARRLASVALDPVPAARQRGAVPGDVRVGRDWHRRARPRRPDRRRATALWSRCSASRRKSSRARRPRSSRIPTTELTSSSCSASSRGQA